jgi:uncharacterized protein YqgC (DUF456 family)
VSDFLGFALAGLLMLIGLISIFIPPVPDMLLIWMGGLAYGLIVGWGEYGGWLFALITLLAVVGGAAEILTSGVGARIGGASPRSLLAGLGLGLVGLLVLGPLGVVAGVLGGIYLMELRRLGDPERALKAMLGLGLGYGASFGVKLILGLAMTGIWLFWVIRG